MHNITNIFIKYLLFFSLQFDFNEKKIKRRTYLGTAFITIMRHNSTFITFNLGTSFNKNSIFMRELQAERGFCFHFSQINTPESLPNITINCKWTGRLP